MKTLKMFLTVCIGYLLALAATPANASFKSVMELFYTMQKEASAWSVNVKQSAVAANQISNMIVNSQQQLATSAGAIAMSDRLVKTVASFSSETGQPESIKCEAQKNGKLFVIADQQKNIDASRLMASMASQSVGSQDQADKNSLAMHRDTYCSVSEAKQGLCDLTPNGMQSWDSNYAGAFSEKTLAPEGELAGYAYAAMVANRRADVQVACTTAACSSAQSDQLASSAISSMVANSFVEQVTSRRMPMLTGK